MISTVDLDILSLKTLIRSDHHKSLFLLGGTTWLAKSKSVHFLFCEMFIDGHLAGEWKY